MTGFARPVISAESILSKFHDCWRRLIRHGWKDRGEPSARQEYDCAFYQPSVIIDTDTLSSLPKREWAAGMAEVIKYGALGDSPFWIGWKPIWTRSMKSTRSRREAIRRSCQMKADIVAADEREVTAAGLTEFRSHLWPRHRS